jgi:acetyl-CoA carboxylase biotin carboxyl carrier protein
MSAKKKGSPVTGASLRGLDLPEVERLLAFMDKHGLDQFEYAQGDLRIALRRASGNAAAQARGRVQAPVAESTSPTIAPEIPPPTQAPPAPAEELHLIKSPIVGTFFAAAGPEAPPFVKVGDHVDSGQVVCIVEAMKLMNEIESDVSGVILRLLVENATPVEYGQPLFAIRPNRKK